MKTWTDLDSVRKTTSFPRVSPPPVFFSMIRGFVPRKSTQAAPSGYGGPWQELNRLAMKLVTAMVRSMMVSRRSYILLLSLMHPPLFLGLSQGLPCIRAKGEAEATCAALSSLGLVDGCQVRQGFVKRDFGPCSGRLPGEMHCRAANSLGWGMFTHSCNVSNAEQRCRRNAVWGGALLPRAAP